MELSDFYSWGSLEDFGNINIEIAKEFTREVNVDFIKLKNMLDSMMVLEVDDTKYYDINYFYKNLLLRRNNINKTYLEKICKETNSKIMVETKNVKYNENSTKTYVKKYTFVTKEMIVYILKEYNSRFNLYFNNYEKYLFHRFYETYIKKDDVTNDFEFIKQNAIKYIESIHLIIMFCKSISIDINNILVFDKERMIMKPFEKSI